MDDSDNGTFSDVVNLLKSWIPWRSEPTNVSRDFWMPDQSCRVCYECDSQFTVFNRRHHCRFCGRIFCARCTSNWISPPSSDKKRLREDWDKIRACNYCFKQWEQGLTSTADNGIQVDNLDLSSTSPSATSFISTKSSGTCDSGSINFASMPHSAGLTPHHHPILMEKTQGLPFAKSNNHSAERGDTSVNEFEFCTNRSDDDDEEFGIYRLDSDRRHFPPIDGCYSHIPFNDIQSDCVPCKGHRDKDDVDSKGMSFSSVHNSFCSQTLEEVQHILQNENEHEISDECEAPSIDGNANVVEDVDAEPVDFENNGLLWLPPEPEDEEDDRDTLTFDDDEDGDAIGEWGCLRTSSSFGSGEYRSNDKSNEENKKGMRNVVDGHFRTLVSQLLQVENLSSGEEDDKDGWLEIITSLSLEAATLLKPDTSKGGQMDPGGYVKVKCLASGHRSESMVVKGVVCKKNVAHRRMASKMEKPRLMILGGALEYQRVSNLLSSVDTLLQQEMDHLKMAVAKIGSHRPDILLVEKSVSRYAQEYLLAKDISLVLNIKRSLLERIARCTGADIVPSIDHLSSPKLGHCEKFHVERFLEEHGTAEQGGKKLMKTLMYFEGCPKPLGYTILLRGANGNELKKVKHVVQYGVFAAYHLALETSFLADEGASLPELPLSSPITVALPDKPSSTDRSISTILGFTILANEKTLGPQCAGEPQMSNSIPTSDLLKVTGVSLQKQQVPETASPPVATSSHCTKSLVSYSGDASQERCLPDLTEYPGRSSEADNILADAESFEMANNFGDSNVNNKQPDGCHVDTNQSSSNPPSMQCDGEHLLQEQTSLKEEFPPSPSDHQSILVSLSSRCVWKGTVCEKSHLFRIKYYGNFDKPLGRFLRDHLFDQGYRCCSCEMPSEAHVQCYTHRQGTLTISVKKLPEILLPGEREGKIWMWHRCLRCPRTNGFPPATRRVHMSDAAWGLSFGKFLELSFSNHAAASRVASCGHSLHRDCLRFYGFGKMVACFRYASIDVYSVYLPPAKLDFNYESQEWIQNELNEVAGRAEVLFSEVQIALRLLVEKKSATDPLNGDMKVHESSCQLADLEGVLQKEKSEFEEAVQKILNKEAKRGQPAIDILELNRLRRQLVFQSYMWDHRLIYAASLDSKNQEDDAFNSEPVEKSPHVDGNLTVTTVPVRTCNDSDHPDVVLLDAKPDKNHDIGSRDGHKYYCEGGDQRSDAGTNSNHQSENPLTSFVGTKASDEFNLLESDDRGPVDEQCPIVASLSDTLDAAWTGENHPRVGFPKNNNFSESVEADSSTSAGMGEKMDVEEQVEDPNWSKVSTSPPVFSAKGSDIMEDSMSWLSMPFISFYRSINKNFSGTAEKLDTLSDYNPVYISSFRELELRGGASLLLPVGVNDTVISVYDDEPTSIISYALVSPDYLVQVSDEIERPTDTTNSMSCMQSLDSANFQSISPFDDVALESYRSFGSAEESILSRSSLPLDPLSYTKALHAKVSFEGEGPLGKEKYTVTCYYAQCFEALRKVCCPSEVDFIRSLSRCKKWGAQGGKSNVFFAKTLDDRFIIKQVTKTELESFIKFAPGYFKYLSESIDSRSPTCLAKILGMYQVMSKHLKGGKESKMDVLIMENLLFGRNLTRLYDLKGSSRSRYNPDSSGSNKVLLDQNLIEAMPTSPIFVGNKAKRFLERAVWNDTAFLASIDVMDYSLLVGVDEEKHELVLGIIDFMRQYTWDKHLETWVKASGILGGPKDASPTVISPKQYKKRFRKAMTAYFLMVPDQWSPPTIAHSKSQTDLCEENAQSVTSAE